MIESMRRFKAGILQALAHPTRIAIVEQLAAGEMTVGRLCEQVGVEQANASQHLAVLRNRHIVQTRKAGNQIHYSLRDPVFGRVLQSLREFILAHMAESLESLRQEQAEADRAARPPTNQTRSRQEARR
jgi:ArsR family transcriptional regulator